tara:strand:+ start:364 stop:471 length:108 start_codon:yes stop_codon:yes gene_type:complete
MTVVCQSWKIAIVADQENIAKPVMKKVVPYTEEWF